MHAPIHPSSQYSIWIALQFSIPIPHPRFSPVNFSPMDMSYGISMWLWHAQSPCYSSSFLPCPGTNRSTKSLLWGLPVCHEKEIAFQKWGSGSWLLNSLVFHLLLVLLSARPERGWVAQMKRVFPLSGHEGTLEHPGAVYPPTGTGSFSFCHLRPFTHPLRALPPRT